MILLSGDGTEHGRYGNIGTGTGIFAVSGLLFFHRIVYYLLTFSIFSGV
jgi:hypothetical protein